MKLRNAKKRRPGGATLPIVLGRQPRRYETTLEPEAGAPPDWFHTRRCRDIVVSERVAARLREDLAPWVLLDEVRINGTLA